jgi:putative solute:sodium symporter small subunit
MASFDPLPSPPAQAPRPPSVARSAQERRLADRHWRQVQCLTGLGLIAWLGVSVGVAWWADDLNRHDMMRMPAGFWWASQGAIGAFLFIIVAYAWTMDVLERRHRAALAALRAAQGVTAELAPAAAVRSH